MDGVGRFAGSLTARLERAGADAFLHVHRTLLARHRRSLAAAQAASDEPYARPSAWDFWLRRLSVRIANLHIPRRAGLYATALLMAATGLYGIQRGGHWPAVNAALVDFGDDMANAAGLQVRAVRLTGNTKLSQEEILEAAGIGPNTSVLFFDPAAARTRLTANPWIAEATVQKLYPDQLLVEIVEREAFALWQRDGKIAVISADGTVIVDRLDSRFQNLPLVVGRGAEKRVREIVQLLNERPAVAANVRAAVLVAERRWNLVLKNGIDVRLPDADAGQALATLARLDAEKRLMSRDVSVIDLRVPGRVTVRLGEDAFRAQEAAIKERQRARRRTTGQET
jgi:cell division protein FtsQ